MFLPLFFLFFFFNDTATTEIYTLSLHDALPISFLAEKERMTSALLKVRLFEKGMEWMDRTTARSEEHTSELQSPCNLVCRLLLEKKKNNIDPDSNHTLTHFERITTVELDLTCFY